MAIHLARKQKQKYLTHFSAKARPDIERSHDITRHPGFRGEISRFLWKIWYVRLTPAGRSLVVLTALLCAVGSNSLNIQAYVPIAYLLCIWGVALSFVLLCKPQITVTAEHTDRIRAGEVLPVTLTVTQKRRFGFAELNIIPFGLPPGLNAIPLDGAMLPSMNRNETAEVDVGVRCIRRGNYTWPGYRAETDFPFGLLRSYANIKTPSHVLVFPEFSPLMNLRIPSGRRYQPGGVAMSSDLGESFEYIGNREYREGDSIRNIDWSATARLGTPIVREYRDEYFLRVGVVLDTHLPHGSGNDAKDEFECAVSVCASVADFMARADYLVDLFAAGPNLYHLTAGRSLAYLDQILDILACVEESKDEPFSTLEPAISDYLSRLTTVVCVFLDWSITRREFVAKLSMEGSAVKVIIVRDRPCTLTPELNERLTLISRAAIEAGLEEL